MTQPERTETKGKSLFGMLGLAALLVFKYKVFIITFGLSLWFYAWRLGWPWALATILLLLMHEMGHFIWMQACGLKPKMPVFIPFFGAMTAMEELPKDDWTQAWTALAGPLIGGACAVGCFYWGLYNNLDFLTHAAYFGILLNLLQLLPARPLDGGFVMEIVAPWFRIPGALLLIGVGWLFSSWFIALIGILGLFIKPSYHEGYKRAGFGEKVAIFFGWAGISTALLFVWVTGVMPMKLITPERDNQTSQVVRPDMSWISSTGGISTRF